MSELSWEWRPGEDETALAVHSSPVGAVIELSDGLVGLRGDTGDELWRYRIPGVESFSVSLSPTGDRALVTAGEVPRALVDTTTGEIMAENGDGDERVRLLNGTLLLHRQGDATEALFQTSDLESGETLWQQEEPSACSGGGPSRLISSLRHSEAIILLLHCGEDTSEGALRVPEPGTVNALVALDPRNGQELWRRESVDTEGRGLASAMMFQETLVTDLPGEDGWLILDPADGGVLAESPKPVLSVDEDTYLAGPDPRNEDLTHELRTFDGEVIAAVSLPEDRWPGDLTGTAVGLPEQLVTVDMERGSPEDSVDALVTSWDGGADVIAATVTERAEISEPGRLLSVPGALLVYVPANHSENVRAVEHVAALQ